MRTLLVCWANLVEVDTEDYDSDAPLTIKEMALQAAALALDDIRNGSITIFEVPIDGLTYFVDAEEKEIVSVQGEAA